MVRKCARPSRSTGLAWPGRRRPTSHSRDGADRGQSHSRGDVGQNFRLRRVCPRSLAGPRVAKLDAVRVARVFVDVENLEARPVGIHVGHMRRIAVAEASRINRFAVVVDAHGAVNDLVLPVAIDVGDAEVVVALTTIRISAPGSPNLSLSKNQRCVSLPSRQSQAARSVGRSSRGT